MVVVVVGVEVDVVEVQVVVVVVVVVTVLVTVVVWCTVGSWNNRPRHRGPRPLWVGVWWLGVCSVACFR